jgi:hypothetical protein
MDTDEKKRLTKMVNLLKELAGAIPATKSGRPSA